ncbi:MAG: DsbA family protein [Actinomycetota bacterium]|nr:DsbA family protein [Actinomycetota bacterium]
MTRSFALTFDYRCPFARNAHEAVVAALREGRDWQVRFLPFSLDQVHVPEGEAPVWKRAQGERGSGIMALEWGIAARDAFPEQFLDFHIALFALRHDLARKLDDVDALRDAAKRSGLDPDAVEAKVATGAPLATLAREHEDAVKTWSVFGVPTFIEDDEAVFVRFMERGRTDDLDRALDLVQWSRLNEFKRTRVPR